MSDSNFARDVTELLLKELEVFAATSRGLRDYFEEISAALQDSALGDVSSHFCLKSKYDWHGEKAVINLTLQPKSTDDTDHVQIIVKPNGTTKIVVYPYALKKRHEETINLDFMNSTPEENAARIVGAIKRLDMDNTNIPNVVTDGHSRLRKKYGLPAPDA